MQQYITGPKVRATLGHLQHDALALGEERTLPAPSRYLPSATISTLQS